MRLLARMGFPQIEGTMSVSARFRSRSITTFSTMQENTEDSLGSMMTQELGILNVEQQDIQICVK